MDPEENRPPIKPIEPGVAYCRCGRRMTVKPWRIHEHLGVPANEIMRRLRREGAISGGKVRQALSEYDIFESWGVTYECAECGTILSDGRAQFTEEEVHEVVARGSAV